jgi:hypothetical protein
MEPEGSVPHSQQLATCPYHAPDTDLFPTHFLKIHFNIILSPTPRCPHQTLYELLVSPISVTYPDNFILLDLITRVKFGKRV